MPKSHKGLVLREVEVKRGGKVFKQKRWVKSDKDEPKEKSSKKEEIKGKESFKVDSKINFLGKDLTIKKVSESEKTAKLSDGKVYTFDAIDKFGKNINKKKTIKDLKINKDKLKKSELNPLFNEDGFIFKSQFNEKILINKSELSKAVNINAQFDEAGYALIPKSHDKENRKFEDKVVTDMNKWIWDREKNLKGELKQFYEDLNY